ncbi:aminoglycoside N(3)-acetyltransferase [Edaphobacillus lindanitolerans]|uniref:Aminoglycoside N(3)-acetyltransferase n=1 Tax=Edaphobacillus lindanitolerans TaxID=550447 RepID=A0A1U7PKZ3_9BACI|nr:AAC(3) family N-acetyltransferase [Edaphobacillus lindanitolerans]SIT87180.1 aminoglycoside 3-N-acetyltransferase [Edaphobacillus lindanitolerans]
MHEFDVMIGTSELITKEILKGQLAGAGIRKGDRIIVHSSMKAIGWVSGGAQAVTEALLETVTEKGTVVMPAQSADNSDPANWQMPPVPEDWQEPIRRSLPAYDPHLTHLRGMGKVAECLHRHPKTFRSPHPSHSFIAWGCDAEEWMREHPLEDSFGEGSPLGKMYGTGMKVVLLGAGYDSCTALHLAEYRAPGLRTYREGAAVMVDGERHWVGYDMAVLDSDDFPVLARAFEREHPGEVAHCRIGQAKTTIVEMDPLVDFGTGWVGKLRAKKEASDIGETRD